MEVALPEPIRWEVALHVGAGRGVGRCPHWPEVPFVAQRSRPWHLLLTLPSSVVSNLPRGQWARRWGQTDLWKQGMGWPGEGAERIK